MPPQKWLAFNALLKNDDGLLSNYIAKQEQVTVSQATSMIKSFVENTKREMSFEKSYFIEGLGIFSQNQEKKIQFQPLYSNNFHSESFGMESVFLKKSESTLNELQVISKPTLNSNNSMQQVFAKNNREPMAEVLEEVESYSHNNKWFSKVSPYVYGLFGSILLISAIYFYDNNHANLSSLNPFQSQSISQPITTPEVKILSSIIIDTKVTEPLDIKPIEEIKAEIIPEVKKTIKETDNRFFIITGSFGSGQNAKKLLASLKTKGFETAEIIYPKRNERLIKVSAGGFTNESDADQESIKVIKAMNLDTWIYKK